MLRMWQPLAPYRSLSIKQNEMKHKLQSSGVLARVQVLNSHCVAAGDPGEGAAQAPIGISIIPESSESTAYVSSMYLGGSVT